MPNGSTQGTPGKFGVFHRPDGKPEMYRSPIAPLVWWVWVLFAAANLADLAVQGRNHFAAMVAVILLLITGVTYVAAFRPRVYADDDGMTIINPLRTWRVPWNCVEGIALGDSLEVFCNWQEGPVADGPGAKGPASNGVASNGSALNGSGLNGSGLSGSGLNGSGRPKAGNQRRKLYGWAVHSPRRSRLKAELRAHRQAGLAERNKLKSYGQLPQEAKDAMKKTDAEHIVHSLESRANSARETAIATRGPEGAWHWVSVAVLVIPALLVIVVGLI